MRDLELLAPAKNLECGMAAIDHGADAVYIGAQKFGARAAAGNSVEDIEKLCRYAHQFGAKVFVTVNTIIYDEEIDDTIALVRQLDAIGVDALLVQDMGLYDLLRKEDLHCELHASTQTDNRSVEKVQWLFDQGFNRIVLARELSIKEIAQIHDNVKVDDGKRDPQLEVFVHGALCVSYSGQCYASQHCFKRSANRGECAQFCRLAFSMKDANGKELLRDSHLLSLRDMAQLDNIDALAEAGASSFKIEGRLKDVDYVKNVTAAYSEELNRIVAKYPQKYRRASFGKCVYTFAPDINKSFNRGFTTYFAKGRQPSIASFDTPKAMGEYVGKVKEIRGHSFNIGTTIAFANGDGLCYLDDKRQLVGFRVNKVEGNRIFPLRMPASLRPGTQLYRNQDQAFSSLLTKPSAERKLKISLHLEDIEGALILTATDEMNRTASIKHQCELQPAEKPQKENIIRQLSKLGGTFFTCNDIKVETEAFIPSSTLAMMRRMVIEKILETEYLVKRASNKGGLHASAANEYKVPYLYNAANNHAKEFYADNGIDSATSFETDIKHNSESILMQCRFCIRHELGYCTKNGKRAPWKDPLSIALPDGREFRLQFDCRNCQMNVVV